MWPWGHLGVGYLCYVALLRARESGRQTTGTLLAVAVGTQFPDLVDKPLAWTFGVLPSGRSLGHSLLTAVVILAVGYRLADRRHRETVVAFGIGAVSHSLVDLGPDVVAGLLSGDPSQLRWTTYLLWPVLPSPPYPHDSSFLRHVGMLEFDAYMLAQFGLFALAVGTWVATGMPGIRGRRRWR